ncbi:uncharacterized protein KD926_000855 [Aspergillus affinis]|uniref:uncharacterized protein n=1 Tax=Aspergillus affinis TaxID=1070780 RepID=UPI0022FE9D97|nr:uncharacterized protein KD926_000855 [Aspergillus affinis]KAI9037069.1 hypothetical protein KD926_000855 [Aspergillus affinis]
MGPSKHRARFFSPHRSSASQSETSSQPDSILTSPSTAALQEPNSSSSATEQAAQHLRTTNRIRTELEEVRRLRRLHDPSLNTDEADKIDRTIADTAEAIYEVAVLLEPTRIEQEVRGGKLSLGSQLRWKYRDSQQVIHKLILLLQCYQDLIPVLSDLRRVNVSQQLPPRRFELEAGVPPSVSLETRDNNIPLDGPARGDIVAPPGGGGKGFLVERPHEKIVGMGAETPGSAMRKPEEKNPVNAGAVNGEMHDLLAWRRSRNPVTETKRSSIYMSPTPKAKGKT